MKTNGLWGLFGFTILAAILLSAVQYKKTDVYDRQAQESEYVSRDVRQLLAVFRYNMSTLHHPPRRPDPTKRLAQEDSLRQLVPVFKDFSARDWKKFWGLLYQPKKLTDWRAMKRWRTKREIEYFFVKKFEDPFARFTPQHWDHFWSIIEEDKRFRHVVYDDTMTEEDELLVKKDKAILLRTPGLVRPQLGYK
jgi:hypothetical protein